MTPDDFTNQEFFLDVGNGHQIYVQDWGKQDTTSPIMFLHGGPGSSVQNKHRAMFDGTEQRVIFFDQRGCGKSTPYGSLEHNTTQNLVEDIEKIANKLELKRFTINGGSWGSCLALAYGLAHPERVKAMVLRGIFTGSQVEIDWLDKGGFQTFFPEVWDQYMHTAPKNSHDQPGIWHFAQVLKGTKTAAKASAYAYENVEGSLMQLDDRFTSEDYDDYDPTGIKMEMYYMKNRCFMPDNYILDNASELTMPIWLVQGRYDMICPPITAYRLGQKLPKCRLIWTISGHKSERESTMIMQTILRQVTGLQ